jgi:primosomal protein N'
MIARIVPAVRLPASATEQFEYSVPEGLAPSIGPGSVVVVPFAGRQVPGLVISAAEKSARDFKLKPVTGIAKGLSPLPPYIPELWSKLAGIFATTLPRWCWLALPSVPSRSIASSGPVFSARPRGNETNEPILGAVFVNAFSDQLAVARKTIASALSRQVLILVPTVREAYAWSRELSASSVYHSALAAGAKYALACSASDGTTKIVIGTKSAVLLPFANLYSVIVVSAGSSSHRQEDSDPRFDARIVAQELCHCVGARLTCLDPWPPFASWPSLNASRPVAVQVHDLADAAKRERAKVLIDEPLIASLDRTIASGGRALLVLNRRGVATSLICRDCGTAVACPDCGLPLASHHERMTCSADERSYPMPISCAKCHGQDLKPIGTGSKAVFDFLKKRFPAAHLAHFDREETGEDPDAAQIVVGTTAVFRALAPSFKPFDLAADVFLGAGTAKNGYDAVEEASRILRSLAAALKPNGELHVQTADREAPALIALRDPGVARTNEAIEREAFGYPPSKTLIVILGAGENEEKTWSAALSARVSLSRAFPGVEICEPSWSRPKIFRKKFRLSFSLKMPAGTDYSGMLAALPQGFAIDARML